MTTTSTTATTTATPQSLEPTRPADTAVETSASGQREMPRPEDETEMLCTLCGLRACWTAS